MHTNMGHRDRMRKRFREEGLDNFEEVHALELLLFYAVPQKDTKPLARALLDKFDTLPQVLEATIPELMTVPGIGESIATYLTLITAAGRYYQVKRNEKPQILNSTEKLGAYFLDRFLGLRNETVFLLCMDAKCKVKCCQKVGEGDVNSASVPIRRLMEIALGVNATVVVLAHNHPSGVAVPSVADRDTTERLATALGAVDIVLADHIVVADGDYVSMVQSRWYDPRQFCRLL